MKRLLPLEIGKKNLKNRLVVPPMASQTATTEGYATNQTIAHYESLCQSGAGLVMVEYSFVDISGRSEPNQLGAHSDNCIQGITKIASAIHKQGALAGFQLTHCGGKAQLDVCPDLQAPAGVTVPAYDRELPKPRTMSVDDIQHWQDSFILASQRVAQAGYDFVELHCAHGYGLNQFLSPITNQRTDQYGGNLRNRAKLVVDIIKGIKKTTNLSVMTRIPGQDLYPGGLNQNDIVSVCHLLIDAGVDVIDVSSGIGGWNRPKDRRGEGFLVAEAHYLKSANLAVPIIGVGGIESTKYIEHALSNNYLDLVAVGRAILKGPLEFNKHFNSHLDLSS